MTNTKTQKEKVFDLLKTRTWVPAAKINKTVGTEHGTRTARRLREDGYILKTRRAGKQTEYRIAGKV